MLAVTSCLLAEMTNYLCHFKKIIISIDKIRQKEGHLQSAYWEAVKNKYFAQTCATIQGDYDIFQRFIKVNRQKSPIKLLKSKKNKQNRDLC